MVTEKKKTADAAGGRSSADKYLTDAGNSNSCNRKCKYKITDKWYKAVIQAAEEGFLLANPEGEILDVNDAFCYMHGYSREELLNMKIQDLDPEFPGFPDTVKKRLSKSAIKPRNMYSYNEVRHIRKDGSVIDLALSMNSLNIAPGFLFCFHRDITESLKAEEVLRQSERKYRELVETSLNMIIAWNKEGEVLFTNNSFREILGYSDEILKETLFIDSILFDENKNVKRIIDSVLANGAPVKFEAKIKAKDGSFIDTLASVTPILDDSGESSGAICFFIDITERKQAEKELRHSEKQLRLLSQRIINTQEEERLKISRELHDQLGQELVLLKMESLSLEEKNGDEALREQIKTLEQMVVRVIESVHNISIGLRPDMLDKLGLVKAIQWYVESFERQTGISCPIEVRAGNRIDIKSQEVTTAAFRIVQEAMTNVLKHSQATQADVSIGIEGERVLIDISDNGIGMDMKDSEDKPSLGLLGMKERAGLIGGEMIISSQPGSGTSIRLYLPADYNGQGKE